MFDVLKAQRKGDRHGAASHRDGDRNAFSVGEPGVDGVGAQGIVAHAQRVRLIVKSRRKDDRLDARTLARLARVDPELLSPVQHHSEQAQLHLAEIRARAALVSDIHGVSAKIHFVTQWLDG